MKTYVECIPCFFNQALRTGRYAKAADEAIYEIMKRIGRQLSVYSVETPPPEMARMIYKNICEITGNVDPYREAKHEHIEEALKLYPKLKSIVEEAKDPLLTAARIAIAGNIIDFGVHDSIDLESVVETILNQELALNDVEAFRQDLERAENILYIGDNAGESVFDRVLIETIGRPLQYAVRGGAVINDVTWDDAVASGLMGSAEILDSGCNAPGALLHYCDSQFLAYYYNADIIISKGQGNYEALSGEKGNIYFLLKAKCSVIARNLGTEVGSLILKSGGVQAQTGV